MEVLLNTGGAAIGGVLLIPLIVGLVQLVKRMIPAAPDNVWLFLSFVLGVAGQCVVWMIATGTAFAAWSLDNVATMVVLGLAFGLAASKAWDEIKDRENALGNAVRGIGNQ
jgi:hypothetical protein